MEPCLPAGHGTDSKLYFTVLMFEVVIAEHIYSGAVFQVYRVYFQMCLSLYFSFNLILLMLLVLPNQNSNLVINDQYLFLIFL